MRNKKNECCVCGEPTKNDGTVQYCDSCGFNIENKTEQSKPNGASDGENMNFNQI